MVKSTKAKILFFKLVDVNLYDNASFECQGRIRMKYRSSIIDLRFPCSNSLSVSTREIILSRMHPQKGQKCNLLNL